MNANFKINRAICIAVVAALLSGVGCTQSIPWKAPKMFNLDSTWPFRDKDAPREGMPVRIVSTWTNTVLTEPGQKPQRGFGGRLVFYDKDGKAPILVEGQLVVYAFDEDGRDPTDNKPTRRYVFPADQIPLHMSKSQLGASYSFWLPWDEVGGPKTEVSLICRFEPKTGGVVTSEQTREVLPGPARTKVAKSKGKDAPDVPAGVPTRSPKQTLESLQRERNDERNAKLISYEAPVASNQPAAVANNASQDNTMPPKRMTATTITLPPNYQLPNVAAMQAAVQAANYPQVPAQVPQPFVPSTTPMQMPTTRTYVASLPGGGMQPVGIPQAYAAVQAQQQAINPQTSRVSGPRSMATTQQFQPGIVQQQLEQRPTIQPAIPPQPWWAQSPQMPMQPMQGAATASNVTYPAPGQVLRQ